MSTATDPVTELRTLAAELDEAQRNLNRIVSDIEKKLAAVRTSVVGNSLEATDVRLSVNRAVMGLGSDAYAATKRDALSQAITAIDEWQRKGVGTTAKAG
jgi:hypothetical protein